MGDPLDNLLYDDYNINYEIEHDDYDDYDDGNNDDGNNDSSNEKIEYIIDIYPETSTENSNNLTEPLKYTEERKKKVKIVEENNNIHHIENNESNIVEYDRKVVTKKTLKSDIDEFVQCMDDVDKWASKCNPNKIFISKSSFTDDNKILALIVKFKIIPYKCSGKDCNISKSWLGHPIQLLIIRKNNNNLDLRPDNLQLLCGNCYLVEYGMKLFKKGSDCVTVKCKNCGKDITNINKKHKGHIDYCRKCLNISLQEKGLIEEERRIKELSKITGEDLSTTVLQEIYDADQAIIHEKTGITRKPRKNSSKTPQKNAGKGGTGDKDPEFSMNTEPINIGELLKSYEKTNNNLSE